MKSEREALRIGQAETKQEKSLGDQTQEFSLGKVQKE